MAENPTQAITNLLGLLIKHLEAQDELVGPVPIGKPPNQERQYSLIQLSHTYSKEFSMPSRHQRRKVSSAICVNWFSKVLA